MEPGDMITPAKSVTGFNIKEINPKLTGQLNLNIN